MCVPGKSFFILRCLLTPAERMRVYSELFMALFKARQRFQGSVVAACCAITPIMMINGSLFIGEQVPLIVDACGILKF